MALVVIISVVVLNLFSCLFICFCTPISKSLVAFVIKHFNLLMKYIRINLRVTMKILLLFLFHVLCIISIHTNLIITLFIITQFLRKHGLKMDPKSV